MAMMCAMTGNDPRFQPGFKDVGTWIAGAVALYGYYGPASDCGLPSSPADYRRPDAPPVTLVNGTRDPMVPVTVARTFATTLRATSQSPVVWVELPGALHTFDRCASIRSVGVLAGVEAFADWLLDTRVGRAIRRRRTTREPTAARALVVHSRSIRGPPPACVDGRMSCSDGLHGKTGFRGVERGRIGVCPRPRYASTTMVSRSPQVVLGGCAARWHGPFRSARSRV